MSKSKKAKHEWYLRNKIKVNNKNKKRRIERKEKMYKFLSGQSCCVCNESSIHCLDFHHIDPNEKEDTVSSLLRDFRSFKKVVEEMNKCAILCSNCHRKLHAGEIHSERILKHKLSVCISIFNGQGGETRTHDFSAPNGVE